MRRIIVLGGAGTGKTTLTRRLATALGAPAIILDALWRPEWGPRDLPAFRARVAAAHAGESWVSDGNFAKATFDLRAPRADLFVWLEAPRWLCAWRCARRVLAPGEAHRPGDLGRVLAFINRFDRVNRPLIEAERLAHAPSTPILRLASRADVDRFVRDLASGGLNR